RGVVHRLSEAGTAEENQHVSTECVKIVVVLVVDSREATGEVSERWDRRVVVEHGPYELEPVLVRVKELEGAEIGEQSYEVRGRRQRSGRRWRAEHVQERLLVGSAGGEQRDRRESTRVGFRQRDHRPNQPRRRI